MRILFDSAINFVREADLDELSYDVRLKLYGLYKHVTCGPCHGDPPSTFAAVKRSKYQAWLECIPMTEEEAIRAYIDLVASIDSTPEQQFRRLAEDINEVEDKSKDSKGLFSEYASTIPISLDSAVPRSTQVQDAQKLRSPSWAESGLALLGTKPIFPRGQLEISFSDLLFAASKCFTMRTSTSRYLKEEAEITKLCSKGEGHVLVGFSVRTLFDLYLRCKAYPVQSEVIVVPPINIPGMIDILRYHDLQVVGVDLPQYEGNNPVIRADVDGVKSAITDKTVAIMVVHPFGIVSASAKEMKELAALASASHIDLIEDCAECFTGLGPHAYMGSVHADISFLSFGTIKTSTSLGGAIGTVRDSTIFESMKRKHMHFYRLQNQSTYFRKIVLASFLKFIAGSPVLHGLLFTFFRSLLGMDFDKLLTLLTRSFTVNSDPSGKICSVNELITQIRIRPCLALLALLKRRLNEGKIRVPSWESKVERFKFMQSLWVSNSIQIGAPIPSTTSIHTHWLCPVLVQDPVALSRKLFYKGFDVPLGLSQLKSITSGTTCPRADKVMASIVYLPISHPQLSHSYMQDLVTAIIECTSKDASTMRVPHNNPHLIVAKKCIVILSLWILSRFAFTSYALGDLILGTVSCLTVLAVFGISIAAVIGAALRWAMADSYMTSTDGFARHCSLMDKCKPVSTLDLKSDGDTLCSPCIDFKKTGNPTSIFLTGATGFVGTSLLHNLLSRRKSQSFCGHIIVLCRPKYGKSGPERIKELLNQPIFSFLTDEEKIHFVKVVDGDISQSNAGLAASDMKSMTEVWNVGVVIHCAASVSFTQSLENAARSNISPSLVLQSFTQRLKHPYARFIYISTAFVHGGETGTPADPLAEKLFSLRQYNPIELYRSMKGSQFYAASAMRELGFPNTYTFSKCICEHLLLSQDQGETIIIRPSIVGPSFCRPYEGWAGQKPSTIVAAVCLQMKSQWNIWNMTDTNVPYIPVDVTTNFILAKAFNDRVSQQCDCPGTPNSCFRAVTDKASSHEISHGTRYGLSTPLPSSLHNDPRIFHATWDVNASETVHFTWRDYAFSVNHAGTVMGHFTRFIAYAVLLVSTKVLPSLNLSGKGLEILHSCLVKPPISFLLSICKVLNWKPRFAADLKKLQPFLDMPLLFAPFTKQTYHFQSGIPIPTRFAGDRYLFTCVVAAHHFLSTSRNGSASHEVMSAVSIAGKNCPQKTMDLWWAFMQPKGSFIIRVAAFILIKLLRAICSDVTVDLSSFSSLHQQIRSENNHVHVILAPTHRSVFDFLLISYIAFALPELNIKIPYIVASDEFATLPVLGWLISYANTIFVRRGAGRDPALAKKVQQLKRDGESIEVFIEGTRSRDRRFAKPKTGFLRCLVDTRGENVIVPICINYERLPEQSAFASEGCMQSRLSTRGLFSWLWEAFSGKTSIGRIHVSASDPILLGEVPISIVNFQEVASLVQMGHKEGIVVSEYHISAAAQALNIDEMVVTRALAALGCKRWPKGSQSMPLALSGPERDSPTQLWSVLLHFGHLLVPSIIVTHPKLGSWLDPGRGDGHPSDCCSDDMDVRLMAKAMIDIFDRSDQLVARAIIQLQKKGFSTPNTSHVLQCALKAFGGNPPIPKGMLRLSVESQVKSTLAILPAMANGDKVPLKVRNVSVANDSNSLGMWGYTDSRFVIQVDSMNTPSVVMKGSRYSLCGRALTKLIPFIENETKCHFNPFNERDLDVENITCFPSDLNARQIEMLKASVFKCSIEAHDRLQHGVGQAQEDVFILRSGHFSSLRYPDIVVWPNSNDQVERVVSLSREHDWCLLPFGGGTNVSHATRCPSKQQEPRPIISVDMTLMSKITWINEDDGLAHVEAGINGSDLAEELRRRGYCFGHEPDSLEFSTLGGWIATKASGMKRGKYGNIEEIVKDVHVVGAQGLLSTENKTVGRSAIGLDLVSLLLGSEGCLGIITSATIRIWALPEVTDFDSIALPDFGHGILFARDMAKLGPLAPASVRLLDNDHFRLGQALHADSSLMERAAVQISKLFSPLLQTMSKESVVCATIMFEGGKDEVREQKKWLRGIVKKHGGVHVGSRIGRAGYELTFSIAYLRDFALTYHFLGDSFETFAPWSKLEAIVLATKERIRKEHMERCLPGLPFIGSRITQLYHEGACVYFYMCMNIDQVTSPSDVFTEIEHVAREEILANGGSLSHHHGVGKAKASFLDDIYSETYRATLASVKKSIDPDNIFGARNGIFS